MAESVFEQLRGLHAVAGGDPSQPGGQRFGFYRYRMQRPAFRRSHLSSRSKVRRRSLGPSYSARVSVRWLMASSPLSTAATAASVRSDASSPMVPTLRVRR